MIRYKNLSTSKKTFYDVTFKPGEVHEVPGFINDLYFIQTNEPLTEEPTKVVIQSTKGGKSSGADKNK